MRDLAKGLFSKKGLAIDFVLAVLWFAFFAVTLRENVPSYKEPYVTFFAVSTAGCLTGIFWLSISMFRVVRTDQRLREKD